MGTKPSVATGGSRLSLGALVITAMLVAGLAIPASGASAVFVAGSAGDPGAPTGANLALLAGIPQSGSRLGKSSAPVTVTLYGDLECPFCKQFVLGKVFSKLITRDVRAGRLQIRYVPYRTATPTESVFLNQQVAALAAGRQHRFWQYAMLFLGHQGSEGTQYVTETFVDNVARLVPGLNFARWETACHDRRLAAQVQSGQHSAHRHHIVGTPTLIFHGPHGTSSPEAALAFPDYRQLEDAVNAVA